MDIAQFRQAVESAFQMPLPPQSDLADLAAINEQYRLATPEILQLWTDKQIDIEQRLAAVPAALAELDNASSVLNYYYAEQEIADALAAPPGVADDAKALAAELEREHTRATTAFAIWREKWVSYQSSLITLLGVVAAQRGIAEHDLTWQKYMSDYYGIDPGSLKSTPPLVHKDGLPC